MTSLHFHFQNVITVSIEIQQDNDSLELYSANGKFQLFEFD